ncbi:MAG: alpha/beta hydrolase [Rhodococcus sp. (in: high G+C Gram-positive bacteria)]|uniref:alpha/beta hydrolase n=1 Tax=Rhodococcus sp. TaxID=1831 RepID=UPI003BB74943
MTSSRPHPTDRLARAVLRAVSALPRPAQRLLGGRPLRIDDAELDTEVQLGLRLMTLAAGTTFEKLPLPEGRAQLDREAWIVGGNVEIGEVRDLTITGADGPIPARLYRPHHHADTPLPVLVYFHGGGFVLGGLGSADSVSRFLAANATVAVLSVDYRLAPEHPFPAGVNDAIAAFDHAIAHADDLGVDPTAVGVGGESAGGNLAAVVALATTVERRTRPDRRVPDFQLLFMPVTDLGSKHRSYELFGEGLFLTEAQMDWYRNHYLTDPAQALDPLVSPLLADDLSGLPPAYVVTAWFDVLRDEGEAYARRMREAGVQVGMRRHPGIVHGLVNATGVGQVATSVLAEAAGAVRLGLRSSVPATIGGGR